jgi:GNAT superfamily N-acetyltransferase
MELNFIEDNNLNFLEKEIKGIEYFPSFDEIAREIENKKYQIIYLVNNKKIIGGSVWYEKNENRAHIYLLFVKKDFRDKDYSKKIIDYTINRIKSYGYSQVSVCVNRSNGKCLDILLKKHFRITSFIFDKDMFLLLKDFEKAENKNYEVLLNLFFDDDLTKKKQNLEKLLMDPTTSLALLKTIDIDNLNIKTMSSLNKFRYLRYLADSNNKSGLYALTELCKEVNKIAKIEPVLDRLKLLKYIAIHGEKKYSEMATKKLYENLPAILNLQNPELQASFLRCLALHLQGEKKKKIISHLKKIKNKQIKNTSLDYYITYNKNAKETKK